MGERLSALYEVTINGKNVPVQKCRVSDIPFNCIWPGHQRPQEQSEEAAFVSCEAEGVARVTVRPHRAFTRCVIRPLSRQVTFSIEDSIISFDAPVGQYTVELDGQHHALHLFIDAVDSMEAHRKDADLYFGPGLHELGRCPLTSNMKVFIDRGAVVFGSFYGRGLENITIAGYGILSGEHDIRTHEDHEVPCAGMGPEWPTGEIQIFESRNIHIEGITFMDAAFWTMTFCACENIVMDNIKHIGMWRYNSDGMNIICSKNVILRNSFLRNFDDVIVPNGRTPWKHIATENVLIENCVLWCDWGRTLEVGVITQLDEMHDITWRNLDLIHNMHSCLSVNNGFWANIHDIRFQDIRVEYSQDCLTPVYQESDAMVYHPETGFLPPLVHIEVHEDYNKGDSRRGQNHDIYIRDIHVLAEEGLGMPPVEILGMDEAHQSWNVFLENMTFNGERIVSAETLNLQVNAYAGSVYLDGVRIH